MLQEGLASGEGSVPRNRAFLPTGLRRGDCRFLPRHRTPAARATILLRRAVAEYLKDELLAALRDCARCIALDENFALAYEGRGLVKSRLGTQDKAIADYTQAVALNPRLANGHRNRGRAKYRLRGRRDVCSVVLLVSFSSVSTSCLATDVLEFLRALAEAVWTQSARVRAWYLEVM
jgi:tetratricopeptide (TPR) repeat protein